MQRPTIIACRECGIPVRVERIVVIDHNARCRFCSRTYRDRFLVHAEAFPAPRPCEAR